MLSSIIILVIISLVVSFVFQKRRLSGVPVITTRTQALSDQGIKNVYLLQGAGYTSGYHKFEQGGSAFQFLAYCQDSKLILETPHFNNMVVYGSWSPCDSIKLESNDHANTIWKKIPGINIDKEKYIICGINVTDLAQVKRLLRTSTVDRTVLEANRTAFENELRTFGFKI